MKHAFQPVCEKRPGAALRGLVPVRRGMAQALACLGLALCGWSLRMAHADPLLDFRMFNVPDPSQLVMKSPVMRWLVRADAQQHCEGAQPKDGHVSRPEGCVYWHRATGTCTLVTTAWTTHSQLGHLFLHCLKGQ